MSMSSIIHLLLLFTPCAQGISAPTQLLSPRTNAAQTELPQQIPSDPMVAFLTILLIIPVSLRIIIDLLDLLSDNYPHLASLPERKIVCLLAQFLASCVIGLAHLIYGMCHKHLGLLGAGTAVLISLYSYHLSPSSSLKLAKILCRFLHISRSPFVQRSLLRHALKELTRIALCSDVFDALSFNDFLDLVVFCVELADAGLLEAIIAARGSWHITSRLREIHRHLSLFQSLHNVRNELVLHGIRTLVYHAKDPWYSIYFRFSSRVYLVIYSTKLEDEQLVNSFLDPNTGKSRRCATKLHELQTLLPDSDRLTHWQRSLLREVLTELLQIAMDENSSAILSFSQQAQLMLSNLQTV